MKNVNRINIRQEIKLKYLDFIFKKMTANFKLTQLNLSRETELNQIKLKKKNTVVANITPFETAFEY